MLDFLSFPLGGLLALVLAGPVEGLAYGAPGGALAGAVIGAAQWLVVMRTYLRVGPEWILATALGVALGDALGALNVKQFQPGDEVFGRKRFGGAKYVVVLKLIYVHAYSSH